MPSMHTQTPVFMPATAMFFSIGPLAPGIQTLKELENSLLTPKTYDAAVRKYPELNEEDLKVQLALF